MQLRYGQHSILYILSKQIHFYLLLSLSINIFFLFPNFHFGRLHMNHLPATWPASAVSNTKKVLTLPSFCFSVRPSSTSSSRQSLLFRPVLNRCFEKYVYKRSLSSSCPYHKGMWFIYSVILMQNRSFCYIEMLMTVLTQIRIVGMDNCIKNEYELDFVYLRFSPLLVVSPRV